MASIAKSRVAQYWLFFIIPLLAGVTAGVFAYVQHQNYSPRVASSEPINIIDIKH